MNVNEYRIILHLMELDKEEAQREQNIYKIRSLDTAIPAIKRLIWSMEKGACTSVGTVKL